MRVEKSTTPYGSHVETRKGMSSVALPGAAPAGVFFVFVAWLNRRGAAKLDEEIAKLGGTE